jgi:hypothetical protein
MDKLLSKMIDINSLRMDKNVLVTQFYAARIAYEFRKCKPGKRGPGAGYVICWLVRDSCVEAPD